MKSSDLMKEVKNMLANFNEYFSYLHGKSDSVKLEMPDVAIKVWANVYSSLSVEERKTAIALTYERHNFHPTPEQFKQLVRGSDEGEALNEWIVILDALRLSPEDAVKRILCLSPHATKALRTVGSLHGLGMCTESQLHSSIKTNFCAAWKAIRDSGIPHHLETVDTPDISSIANSTEMMDSAMVRQKIAALTAHLNR